MADRQGVMSAGLNLQGDPSGLQRTSQDAPHATVYPKAGPLASTGDVPLTPELIARVCSRVKQKPSATAPGSATDRLLIDLGNGERLTDWFDTDSGRWRALLINCNAGRVSEIEGHENAPSGKRKKSAAPAPDPAIDFPLIDLGNDERLAFWFNTDSGRWRWILIDFDAERVGEIEEHEKAPSGERTKSAATAPDPIIDFPLIDLGNAERLAFWFDTDSGRWRWVLIDFDAERVSEISATDDEHEAAMACCKAVRAELQAEGWSETIQGDSGNGGHHDRTARIALPRSPASRRRRFFYD